MTCVYLTPIRSNAGTACSLDLASQTTPEAGAEGIKGVAGTKLCRSGPVKGDQLIQDHSSRPGRHHHYSVAQENRLLQAVSYEDHRSAISFPNLEKLFLKNLTQLSIKSGKRFVHQENLGFDG